MAASPRKIMILTADAGFGHRSAAIAVSEALTRKYGTAVQVTIINPLDNEKTPAFLRDSQADYDKWIKEVPDLYQLGYTASDNPVPVMIMEQWLGLLLFEVIKEVISSFKPHVILTTYPMYQAPLALLFRTRKVRVPCYTVITDLSTIHRLWFNSKMDGCLVPNQLVADLAMSNHIAPEKITITGIPVHPDIPQETRSKNEIRKELGWQLDIPTILAVGSKRVDRLMDALNVVNHFGAEFQVAVVAGRNEELFSELSRYNWHIPVQIYNFAENMPALMKASDLIVCKAGGLIVTESLACGLPLILIEVIPGQETGNADYVTTFGAADIAESATQMQETLFHLCMNDYTLLKNRAEHARRLGLGNSAYAVADILWAAAQRKPKSSVQPQRPRTRVKIEAKNNI